MGLVKNKVRVVGIITCCLVCAHAQKPPVIFEVSTLVKQDTDARKKILLTKLQEAYHRKNYSTLALWHTIRDVFDVPFFCNEREVRLEFYKFLEKIKLPEKYPTITFEGDPLPPIISALNLNKLTAKEAIRMADEYVDIQDYSERDKNFYHALIYVTFDPEVSKETRSINNKTQKLLDFCRTCGNPAYLVGHCDLVVCIWLKEHCADLLSKFDKVLFSNQAIKLPQTHFDDGWWLTQLKLADIANASSSYFYINDWVAGGVKGDAPPHYASTSKTLRKMLLEK